ncbi:MAG: NmrA family NAD(P)-binding protein, partial [Parvularcula sp.]|jgi:uncharacterized protein YbjT (DUF2867 family)|nr:NmrA family NAD(P)-binding protein [Parvularcula sp.]
MMFVVGASGRMGGAVLRFVQSGTRAGSRSGKSVNNATETVKFDLGEPALSMSALNGCETLFLMRPPKITKRQPFNNLMQTARRAGIRHIVCASVYGAGNSRVLPHRHMEAAVRESGLPYTFLRPADFMQNLTDVHTASIRERHEIAVPAGNGRSAFLDVEDVGRATCAILNDCEKHSGKAYNLTGPQALAFNDIAQMMTEEIGPPPIRYRPVSIARFLYEQIRRGTPGTMALVMAGLYTVQRLGRAAPVSQDFLQLTNEPAGNFRRFLQRHRTLFDSFPRSAS